MVSLFLVLLAAVPAIAVREEIHYDHARRDNENQDRIIDGVPADIEEFPFLVSIITIYVNNSPNTTYQYICGGTIITESWVLTAAHCLEIGESLHLVAITVRGGSSYYLKGGVIRYGKETVSNQFPPHDIGLIKVDEPWPLNGITISLARLPRQDDPIPVGSPATIMGWGRTEIDGTRPEIMMKGEVLVISSVYCPIEQLEVSNRDPDKLICTNFGAGKTPSHTWKGDSGGPVLVNGEVAGIASEGFGVAGEEFPGIHTRVSSYIDWIEQNVGPLPRDM